MSTTTGLVWDERCMWHDTGNAQLGLPGSIGAVQPAPFGGPRPAAR